MQTIDGAKRLLNCFCAAVYRGICTRGGHGDLRCCGVDVFLMR